MVKHRPLTDSELSELTRLAEDSGRVDELYVRALAHTGLRAAELAHMEDSWLDRGSKMIRIPDSRPCGCSECTDPESADSGVWVPKTTSSIRAVPVVDDRALALLVGWFKQADEIGHSRFSIYRRIKKFEDRVNTTKKITPHVLRSTYATRLANGGIDPYKLKAVMGWSDLTTAQEYIEQAPDLIQAAVEDIYSEYDLSEVHRTVRG